jgi:energy-coupling factor transporter ATP-binding protein EcfA2
MSRSDLESLTIFNVRGVVQSFTLNFDKHRKLCVVYGENGTGKTTLCDAMELLGAGTMGSLDDRGLGKVERYWHPAGQALTPGTIELKAAGAGYAAAVKAGKVTWTPDQRPQVRVLRRPQLLRIVTATAAKRYEAIGELVDVSGVEHSEQALANLVKETERDVAERTARIAGAQEILQKLFTASTPEGGDWLAWARGEADRRDSDLLGAANALDALKTAYEVLVGRQRSYVAASAEVASAVEGAEAATAAVTQADAAGSVADSELLAVLEAASKLMAAARHPEVCPLCEGMEHVADLESRVSERLSAMSALRTARGRQSDANRDLAAAHTRLAQIEKDYATERAAFEALLVAHPERADSGAIPSEAPPVDIADLANWLVRTAAVMEELTRRHRDLTVRASNATNLRDALSTYDENYALADRSSKLYASLKRGLELARAARHAFVNELLAGISTEVGRLYEAVHPSEGLASVSLSLDERKRASLDLLTCFQASDGVPPQAYFSDSHLDTLGLCVFLALAKQRAAHRTVMVLDDVLASVDEPHVDRLIQMIYEEAQHFRHVVVTTHYRPWREKLRWGWLKQGQCQLVELGPWSASVGPSLVRSTSEIERLRKVLREENDFDGQAACGKAGVVLEAVLDFLTELYKCKLPRTSRNEWTLGDLLPAIGKKLRAALRVEFQDPGHPTNYVSHDVGPILDELERIAQSRNLLGAHFNKLSFSLLDANAKHFANKVLELADLLVHPEHGWPRSNRSGSYWSTAKDARRLHPLQEPA